MSLPNNFLVPSRGSHLAKRWAHFEFPIGLEGDGDGESAIGVTAEICCDVCLSWVSNKSASKGTHYITKNTLKNLKILQVFCCVTDKKSLLLQRHLKNYLKVSISFSYLILSSLSRFSFVANISMINPFFLVNLTIPSSSSFHLSFNIYIFQYKDGF